MTAPAMTTCPECGSTSLAVNAWEAWCGDCSWRITDQHPDFAAIRQAELDRRGQIAHLFQERP